MRSFRQLALFGLPLLGGVVANNEPASPSPTKSEAQNVADVVYANAHEAFQDLLNALPEESLHVALNSLNHFRDGVFESNKRGVEHIHQDNPPLATKLIVAAVNDLKKRQVPTSNNGTAPTSQTEQPQSTEAPQSTDSPQSTEAPQSSDTPQSTESSPESSQAPESSGDQPQSTRAPGSSNAAPQSSAAPAESSAVVVPIVVTTTDSEGRTSVASSEILSRPTASIAVPVTHTNAQGSTEVTTETKPAVIFSTTDSAGRAIMTTSAVNYAPTRGQVLTQSNAEGSTFLTTYTPGSGRVSSIMLLTTTGSDGQQSVVTSYTYVDPAAQATGDSTEEPGSTAQPSLQKGAAAGYRVVDAAVFGGAALAWFI
ncbi:hypothetical protein PMIN06_002752 [Paraphaeosphaeria minitans]